ncbi:MAG: YnbE family lipoprotein [Deltaproteobacteria bacterium]|nr:YnbE family lipoprotein [Deltaproteobacteria bacterium]MBW2399152.1 YnbE family lipoprotein [Deltaproteobacteria bacterium]MBW2666459.1 YnbE family lipoprotein [Deltaproteobacteria bacterium]
MDDRKCVGLAALVALLLIAPGCTPKIVVEAPKEPIVINMNVKIEHEIRIRVDKDLDMMFENEDLF